MDSLGSKREKKSKKMVDTLERRFSEGEGRDESIEMIIKVNEDKIEKQEAKKEEIKLEVPKENKGKKTTMDKL